MGQHTEEDEIRIACEELWVAVADAYADTVYRVSLDALCDPDIFDYSASPFDFVDCHAEKRDLQSVSKMELPPVTAELVRLKTEIIRAEWSAAQAELRSGKKLD